MIGQRHLQPRTKLPASNLQLLSPSRSLVESCAAVPELLQLLPQLDMRPPGSAEEPGS